MSLGQVRSQAGPRSATALLSFALAICPPSASPSDITTCPKVKDALSRAATQCGLCAGHREIPGGQLGFS